MLYVAYYTSVCETFCQYTAVGNASMVTKLNWLQSSEALTHWQ